MMKLLRKPELLVVLCMATVWMLVFLYIAFDGSLSESGFNEYYRRNKNAYRELDRRLWGSLTKKHLKAYEREIILAKFKIKNHLKVSVPKELLRSGYKEQAIELEGDQKETRRKSSWRARLNKKKITTEELNYKPNWRSYVSTIQAKDLIQYKDDNKEIRTVWKKFPNHVMAHSLQRGSRKSPNSEAVQKEHTRINMPNGELAVTTEWRLRNDLSNDNARTVLPGELVKTKVVYEQPLKTIASFYSNVKTRPTHRVNAQAVTELVSLENLATLAGRKKPSENRDVPGVINNDLKANLVTPVSSEAKKSYLIDDVKATVGQGTKDHISSVSRANNDKKQNNVLGKNAEVDSNKVLLSTASSTEKKSLGLESYNAAVLNINQPPEIYTGDASLTVLINTPRDIKALKTKILIDKKSPNTEAPRTTQQTKHPKDVENILITVPRSTLGMIKPTSSPHISKLDVIRRTGKSNDTKEPNSEPPSLVPKENSKSDEMNKNDKVFVAKNVVSNLESNDKGIKPDGEKREILTAVRNTADFTSLPIISDNSNDTVKSGSEQHDKTNVLHHKGDNVVKEKVLKDVIINKGSNVSSKVVPVGRDKLGGVGIIKDGIRGTAVNSNVIPATKIQRDSAHSTANGVAMSTVTQIIKDTKGVVSAEKIVDSKKKDTKTNSMEDKGISYAAPVRIGKVKNLNDQSKLSSSTNDSNTKDESKRKAVKDHTSHGMVPSSANAHNDNVPRIKVEEILPKESSSSQVKSSSGPSLQHSKYPTSENVKSDLRGSIDKLPTHPTAAILNTAAKITLEKERKGKQEHSKQPTIQAHEKQSTQLVKNESKILKKHRISLRDIPSPVFKIVTQKRKVNAAKMKNNSLLRAAKRNL